MSFLNPVPVPATYYSSEDAEAPQLGADLTGGVKTVLKACLVTGYGTKPGAGWDHDRRGGSQGCLYCA